LFSYSASGGTLQRLVVWIAATGLALFTLWFAVVHGNAKGEPKDEEGYELLQGRSSIDDMPVDRTDDDVEAKLGSQGLGSSSMSDSAQLPREHRCA
jgi:hypothetical protein